MKKNRLLLPILLAAVAILVIFDQWTKKISVLHLKGQSAIELIPGVLEFHYLENHGAAFSMLQNKQYFFWILTAIFICLAIWFFIKVPKTSFYAPMIATITVLLAGAIGNFIDRLTLRYVVDFIYFRLINFPVFNVADIYVSLSVVAMVLLILFKYKDGDFAFLSIKKQKD